MKKQVTYQNAIPRLFAACLDLILLLLLLVLLGPLGKALQSASFSYIFADFISQNPLSGENLILPNSYLRAEEFIEYVKSHGKAKLFYFGLCELAFQTSVMALFFLGFWISKATTPGKAVLGMKIADAKTLGKPSVGQCVKRFFAYPTSILGIILVPFTQKKQAFHDKIAGTVVINL